MIDLFQGRMTSTWRNETPAQFIKFFIDYILPTVRFTRIKFGVFIWHEHNVPNFGVVSRRELSVAEIVVDIFATLFPGGQQQLLHRPRNFICEQKMRS